MRICVVYNVIFIVMKSELHRDYPIMLAEAK